MFSTLSEEARLTLERNQDWVRTVAPSARVIRATFPIMVHGVRVDAIDTLAQQNTITSIYEQNSRLHTNLEITRVGWMKKAITQKKRYSSLIVETASPHIANAIIQGGLIIEGELKECEKYKSNERMTQCFKCYHYGHVGKACNRPQSCGFCSGPHVTDSCPDKDPKNNKCATCKGNHPAWARTCKVRRAEIEKSIAIKRYSSNVYVAPPPYSQSSRDTPLADASTQPATINLSQAEGWEIVKRRKGRPSGLTQASQDPAQTRIPTSTLKRRRSPSAPPSQSARDNVSIREVTTIEAENDEL